MAEASLDSLFASPGGEAELAIDPVASVESVVHAVSLQYWSAIRQERIDGTRTYRYSGGGNKSVATKQQ